MLLLAGGISCAAAAQTFTPPGVPDHIYPAVSDSVVREVQHTSCYAKRNVDWYDNKQDTSPETNNLYLHTWNTINYQPSGNGIAWRRTNTADATINEGFVTMPNMVYDLEVGMMQAGKTIYVFVSYCVPGNPCAFYYDVYIWGPTGLAPWSMGNLLGTDSLFHRRISMDCHDLNKLVIAWQDASGVRVKAFTTTATAYTTWGTKTISGTSTGALPDVAIGNPPGGPVVRVAYVGNWTGTAPYPIYVRSRALATVATAGSATLSFTLDDTNPGAYVGGFYDLSDNNLNLDCPDQTLEDNWAYVYSVDQHLIMARMRTLSVGSAAFTITPPLTNVGGGGDLASQFNRFPVVTYSQDPRRLYFGWFTNFGGQGYVAVHYHDNGASIWPAGNYKKIANTPAFPTYPLLTFNKENTTAARLFLAYPMLPPVISEMRTKLIPFGATSFSGRANGNIETLATGMPEIVVYPNPFRDGFSLKSSAPGNTLHQMVLMDVQGRVLLESMGTVEEVNNALQQKSRGLGNGVYYINVMLPELRQSRTIAVTKTGN
jgi:hypothetical protein